MKLKAIAIFMSLLVLLACVAAPVLAQGSNTGGSKAGTGSSQGTSGVGICDKPQGTGPDRESLGAAVASDNVGMGAWNTGATGSQGTGGISGATGGSNVGTSGSRCTGGVNPYGSARGTGISGGQYTGGTSGTGGGTR